MALRHKKKEAFHTNIPFNAMNAVLQKPAKIHSSVWNSAQVTAFFHNGFSSVSPW